MFKSGLSAEYILKASLCRLPRVSSPTDEAMYPNKNDWRRPEQVYRSAVSELENLQWSPEYADSGYGDKPAKGILLADWNPFPDHIDALLERAGYAVEWSDEWAQCADCLGAIRTQPNSYDWTPQYEEVEGDYLCFKCSGHDEREKTRKDAEEAVKGPGKFEGEPSYVFYFWEQSLDGCYEQLEDSDGSTYFYTQISEEDSRIFPDLKDSIDKYILLSESDSGFVSGTIQDDEPQPEETNDEEDSNG